jgi:Fe-S cluster assembly iron-binding protein IscA
MMLTFEAAEAIRRLAETRGAEGLRIFRAGGSLESSGVDLRIEPAAGPGPRDTVVELEGAQLFLDPEAERTMEGKLLDTEVKGDDVRFALLEQMDEEPGA